ncbi:hypothetical protein BCR35DRAFT_335801 [Leucosporidium creatinivorum]|uniref:Uncharacterized protein n=1 Tax=Leucosporidium creatinivorum TaxID=106004 RepID=A0A1Y2D528_9BASI|nr:hypothetical protein BCR35DRAFT_335801 [Leucosporidium creatinivorum]
MCRSSVILFYGLWVKTWSLAFAAHAHEKIQPPLLALDLLIARRRSGKLVVEEQDLQTTARDLPEEVWELIKQETIDEAIHQEEEEAFELYRCPSCKFALGKNWETALDKDPFFGINGKKRKAEAWTDWRDPRCHECTTWIWRWHGDFAWQRRRAAVERMAALLAGFGLRVASKSTLCTNAEQSPRFDELSGLALPLQSSSESHNPAVDVNLRGDQHERHESAVLELSPTAIALPSNAELRFRRLISTYQLEPEDPTSSTITTNTLLPLDPSGATQSASESQDGAFRKDEPRWMLRVHAEADW